MELSIIIGLVLYAACIFLIIKFVKNILVAIGTILLFSVLFLTGTGFFIHSEISELQQEFPVSNNLLLLRDGDQVLAGLVILPSEDNNLMDGLRILEYHHIGNLSEHLASDNEDLMFEVVRSSNFIDEEIIENSEFRDNTYKIIFVEASVIEDSPFGYIDFSSLTGMDPEDSIFKPIPSSSVLDIMKSDDPWELLLDYVREDDVSVDFSEFEQMLEEMNLTIVESGFENDPRVDKLDAIRFGLVEQFGNDDVGGFLFLLSLASISTNEDAEGIRYLFSKYKDEEIYIRDTSIIFDLLRLSPNALIDRVIQESGNAVQEVRSRVESEFDEDVIDYEDYMQDNNTLAD